MAKGNFEKVSDGIKYAVNVITSVKLKTFFKFIMYIIITLCAIFCLNVARSQSSVDRIIEHALEKAKNEQKDMSIRDMVSPKIQRGLIELIFTLNCDRAFIIELHNGKKNVTELPFKYFDMTYEEVNENRLVKHVSQYFVNTMVTHYKLPYYLSKYTFFVGSTVEMAEIDRRFADNFEEYGVKYSAFITLRNDVEEIGFLGVSYNDTSNVPDKEKIIDTLSVCGKRMKDLLDLGTKRVTIEVDENGKIIDD